ncbi:MAG: KpsF/GutQ family sugar-phosphate isomerase [Chitinophagaceae bacterium]
MNIRETALNTIDLEASSVAGLKAFINEDFERTVELIHTHNGRVVVTGIGKSAIIGQKIVATLNSTGTPALFMHAADAIHGDLGMIQVNDAVMVLSKSGESPEIKVLLPLIRNFGNKIIAMVGNTGSFLARNADLVLNTTVSQEACPNNLAPTSSTTAQLVMGDALAVCLMKLKGFTGADFAKYHPGGMLGKQLYLRVGDLSVHNEKPVVETTATLKEVIMEISRKRLGATAVTEKNGTLVGIITDGDVRRMLENTIDLNGIKAIDIAGRAPKTIGEDALAVDALALMRAHNINQLLVTRNGNYAGILHIHDLIREGLI